MKNSQKGSVSLIILIIVVALVIGGGVYFYLKNSFGGTNLITNPNFSHPEICNPGSIEKQPQSIQDRCYQQIAMDTKNPALCDKIQEMGGIKLNCFASTAISTRNPYVCKMIPESNNDAYRSNCFEIYAWTTLEPQICANIVSGQDFEFHRNYCYRETASKAKDNTICNNISDKTTQKYCIEESSK